MVTRGKRTDVCIDQSSGDRPDDRNMSPTTCAPYTHLATAPCRHGNRRTEPGLQSHQCAATAHRCAGCNVNELISRLTRYLHCTTGCTTGCRNYANEPSQAALERPSQDVYDVIASQQGACVDSRRSGAFDQMNIQNVATSRLYNRL